MNEEALQYSFELFTNDGYEGTIEEYKKKPKKIAKKGICLIDDE